MKYSLMIAIMMQVGCGTPAVQSTPQAETVQPTEAKRDPRVEKAIALRAAVSASPGQADEVLAKHGETRATLDALLYEIAEDPALSAEYASAK